MNPHLISGAEPYDAASANHWPHSMRQVHRHIHRRPDRKRTRRLHQHATEEMGYLAEILPTVYKRYTQDNAF